MTNAYLFLIAVTISLHFFLQAVIPGYPKPQIPGQPIDLLFKVSILVALIGFLKIRKYPQVLFLSLFVLSLLSVVYLNFVLSYPGSSNPDQLSSLPTSQNSSIKKDYTEFTDPRCLFFEDYRVTRVSQTEYILTDYGHTPGTFYVNYLPNQNQAVVKMNSDDYSDPHLVLLDFTSCDTTRLYKYNFDTRYFLPKTLSISPNSRLIVYEIYHGFDDLVMDDKILETYPQVAKTINGIWIYDIKTQKNRLLKSLPVDTDTSDLLITWDQNRVILTGIGCPKSGCIYGTD